MDYTNEYSTFTLLDREGETVPRGIMSSGEVEVCAIGTHLCSILRRERGERMEGWISARCVGVVSYLAEDRWQFSLETCVHYRSPEHS